MTAPAGWEQQAAEAEGCHCLGGDSKATGWLDQEGQEMLSEKARTTMPIKTSAATGQGGRSAKGRRGDSRSLENEGLNKSKGGL